jgi:hypothetical protein
MNCRSSRSLRHRRPPQGWYNEDVPSSEEEDVEEDVASSSSNGDGALPKETRHMYSFHQRER